MRRRGVSRTIRTRLALATVGANGAPSVRMVLMKMADARGFSFYTNEGSEKGIQLGENPRAAMCFHWKTLRRQVRVEGTVTELPGPEVDAYFHSRSRRSQLGSAVSHQSHALGSREEMEEAGSAVWGGAPGGGAAAGVLEGVLLTSGAGGVLAGWEGSAA